MEQISTTIKDRLYQIIEHKGITANKFEKETGLTTSFVRNTKKEIGSDKIKKILLCYPEINPLWLIGCEGDMLINDNTQTPAHTGEINQINNQAPNVFDDSVFECGFPAGESGAITQQSMKNVLIVPNAPTDVLYVRAHGNSMVSRDASLSIPDGSFVAIRKLKTNVIRWGEIYALATRDGLVIKRLLPDRENTEVVRCLSLNAEDYPEFELSKQDIIDIAIVVGVVTLQWIA